MLDAQMAQVYLTDMRAMLAAMRRFLEHLQAAPNQPLQARTAGDLRHTAATLAELSRAFHVPDCATVAEALAGACSPIATGGALPTALLARAAEVLAYLDERATHMAAAGQLVAPNDTEHATANRLIALVVTAGDPAVAWNTLAGTANSAQAAAHPLASGELTPEDLAIIQAFRDAPLAPPRTPPAVRWPTNLAAPDLLDPPGTAPLDPADGALLAEIEALPAHLLHVFVSDLEHNLQEVRHALTTFEQHPDDHAPLAHIALVAHRIKGDAGTFEYPLLAELAHAFESQVHLLRSRQVATNGRSLDLLARGLGELDLACAAIVAGAKPEAESLARMRATTQALLGDASNGSAPQAANAPTQAALPLMAPAELAGAAESEPGGSLGRTAGSDALLRVDVHRIDELLRRTDALTVNRAELERVRAAATELRADLERAIGRLDTLCVRLREVSPTSAPPPSVPPLAAPAMPLPEPPSFLRDKRPDSTLAQVSSAFAAMPAVPGAPSARANLPEVERYTEYDQLTLALTEAVADVASCGRTLRSVLQHVQRLTHAQQDLARDIQQAVMRVRLVPLRDQIVLLQQAIRVLSAREGKVVSLVTKGELAEIDRDVSEALSEILLHLVRNAVAHGIERPEERFAVGKPPEGQIILSTEYVGHEVSIEVRDDGRGINPERVRASARAAEAIDATAAHALSADDALNLIFEAGVSTAARATVASGHGMGLADVAKSLAQLHGTIRVRSVLGEGTTFVLRVPISLSTIHALHVRVAGQDYFVPQAVIQQTLPLPDQSGLRAPSGPTTESGSATPGVVPWRLAFMEEGRPEEIALYALAHLLGRPYIAASHESALVSTVGRKRIAFVVDQIAGHDDVVVHSLPPHLRRTGVRGTAMAPTGELMLVLDLPALASRTLAQPAPDQPLARQTQPISPRAALARPRLLIADDSVSMRHAFEAILTRAGYLVETARDGMETLEAVLADPPQLLILDIEMPRLDGFELLGVLRARPQLAAIPVIMLTSRGAQRHRQHAEALGADAYLVKPVTEDDLLATVARLLAAATGGDRNPSET